MRRGNRERAAATMIPQTYLYAGKDSTLRIKTSRAGLLGGDDGEEGPFADRPERRVDHPQGHHATDPGDPAAAPGPRRVLGRGRVRGVLPPAEEGMTTDGRSSGGHPNETIRGARTCCPSQPPNSGLEFEVRDGLF